MSIRKRFRIFFQDSSFTSKMTFGIEKTRNSGSNQDLNDLCKSIRINIIASGVRHRHGDHVRVHGSAFDLCL